MVNRSKNIEVNETINPNIIRGLDLVFSSIFSLFFEEEKFLSFFLFSSLGNGLITINFKFKFINQYF